MFLKLKSIRYNHGRLWAAMLAFFSFSAALPAAQVGTGPVKIFIMIGQSNTQGHGELSPAATPGTLEYVVANDPGNKYQFLVDGSNWAERADAWIHYERSPGNLYKGPLTAGYGAATTATTIGPELGFGHHVGNLYEQQVLVVKCAWGGKSLGNDFLPPSSGPYPTPQVVGDAGFYYQEVLRIVNDVTTNLGTHFPDYNGQGYEIAGICWHQGWNDRVTGAFATAYKVNMANFINDIRSSDKGLDVPGLPFVIATTGMDGSPDVYTTVETAQKKMDNSTGDYPAFAGNVAVVDTRLTYPYDNGMVLEFWQPDTSSPLAQVHHWNRNAKTYLHIGLAMGDAMSTLSPSRCPARLRAVPGASGGVELSWQNGTEVPTSVQIKRGGVTLAAAAPANPAVFSDPDAESGLLAYELVFTMPGDPCDPLTLTFDGGVQGLEAFRTGGGVGLTWTNSMTYDALEVKRNGTTIEAAFSGTATSYTDTSAPTSGLVTYTVAPTTGTSTPASSQINLDAAPSGNVVIYEPFDYPVGDLNGQSGISEVGLEGNWSANTTSQIVASSLSYGTLPVAGNSVGGLTPSQNRYGGSRSVRAAALADVGLLDDGQSLWFSVIVGYGAGVNGTNARLAIALANNAFSTNNFTYNIPNSGTGSGLGLSLYSGGRVAATQFQDSDAGGGISGNVLGTVSDAFFGESSHGLIVGRIDWGAGADTITLYYPDTDLALPATPISTLTVNVDQSTYDTITWARGDVVVMDEIRFGASYDDVTGAAAVTDSAAPTPNAAQFESAPAAENDATINMTAVTGTDLSGPVQYLFTETTGNPGATSSDWQTSPNYTDTGLQGATTYTYTVTMRDRRGNTGTASTAAQVTTNATDVTAPTPNPMTFATAPTAISNTEVTMTATTATDAQYAVQYYFEETSGHPGGSDSGWQDSATYIDSGLNPNTSYTYTVQARDTASTPNAGTASDSATVSTLNLDTTPPTPDPAAFTVVPSAVSDTAVTMTATRANDPNGVEYYFSNRSFIDGSHDSGWQDSATYVDSGLSAFTSYVYQATVRDKSTSQNETVASTLLAVVTDPDPAVTVPTLSEGAFHIMGSANTGGANFVVSVVPGAARYSGTTGANGPVYSSFGDGTVLDYRLFQEGAGETIQAYSSGAAGRISNVTSPSTSISNISYADVWTTSDPGADFTANGADFTSNTAAAFGNSSASGTIDISGMGEGIIYFIYGSYRNQPDIDLVMSGTGQPDVILNNAGDNDFANNHENYIVAVNFLAAGDYDTISYTLNSGNGWLAGVVLDDALRPAAVSPYDNWSGDPGSSFLGTLTDPSEGLDFDNGGLDTGVEWVLGGDPTNAGDDALVAPVMDSTTDPDFFIFTYRRADVAYGDANTAIFVEYGSNLTGWTPAVDNNDTIEIVETDDHFGAGIDRVVVKIKLTLGVGGKIFVRLKVATTP